jgi:uncharacterized protein (TIGR02145 family)
MNTIKILKVGIAAAFFLATITCTKDPVGPGPVNITGTVVDIDGNVYTTVKIGTQEWMVENLRTTRYNDGTVIPLVTDDIAWGNINTPLYCWYNNDATNKAKYGALYNWYTVDPVNPKKIAPAGWHVPTDVEWDTLQNYLIAFGYNWDGTTIGNKIAKSLASKTDWATDTSLGVIGCDLTSNNRSGFSALPGGYRDIDGMFKFMTGLAGWWSTTWVDYHIAYSRTLYWASDYLGRKIDYTNLGHSVRLLRD